MCNLSSKSALRCITGEKSQYTKFHEKEIREKDEFVATIVFAETRGQAKVAAQWTDVCDGVDFMEIECRRMKEADKYYRPGKSELDWENPEDRIAMVKDCGFTCDWDARSVSECAQCSAKEFCDEAIE